MTGAQAAWLKANPRYRVVVSHAASFGRYAEMGILHGDGTFEAKSKGKVMRVTPGCFEVGIWQHNPPPDRH